MKETISSKKVFSRTKNLKIYKEEEFIMPLKKESLLNIALNLINNNKKKNRLIII